MALHQRRSHAGPFPSRRGKYLHRVSPRSGQARARALSALAEIAEPLSARASARRTKAIREMASAGRPRETQPERRRDSLVPPRDRGTGAADGPENLVDQSLLAAAISRRTDLIRQRRVSLLVAARLSRLRRVRFEDRPRRCGPGCGRNVVTSRDQPRFHWRTPPGPARRQYSQ